MIVSAILLIGSFVVLFTKGLNYGIEFTGGSVVEMSYDKKPDIAILQKNLDVIAYKGKIQEVGNTGIILRGEEIKEGAQAKIFAALKVEGLKDTLVRQDSIGSSMSHELKQKSLISILLVILCIIIFISYAFRHVSYPVSSYKYGIVAVLTLLHDIMIPVGFYAYSGREIDTLFVVGILSILGLSLNDTIVVFDRIRENLMNAKAGTKDMTKVEFEEIIGSSLSQTVVRSINTTVVLSITLVALILYGPTSVYNLVFVLLVGMIVGAYSSIFVASPALTYIANLNRKPAVKK